MEQKPGWLMQFQAKKLKPCGSGKKKTWIKKFNTYQKGSTPTFSVLLGNGIAEHFLNWPISHLISLKTWVELNSFNCVGISHEFQLDHLIGAESSHPPRATNSSQPATEGGVSSYRGRPEVAAKKLGGGLWKGFSGFKLVHCFPPQTSIWFTSIHSHGTIFQGSRWIWGTWCQNTTRIILH